MDHMVSTENKEEPQMGVQVKGVITPVEEHVVARRLGDIVWRNRQP